MTSLTQPSRVQRLLCASLVSLFVVPTFFVFPWSSPLPNVLATFAISVLAFAVSASWSLWIRQGAGAWKVRWYPETEGALLLFICLTTLSAVVTSGGLASLRWFSELGEGLLLFLVVQAIIDSREQLRIACALLSTGGAVLAAIAITLWTYLWAMPSPPALATWLNPNYTAVLLLLPWFVTLHDVLSRPPGRKGLGAEARFAFISTALLMSRSRAAWLGIVVGLLWSALGERGLHAPQPRLRRRVIAAFSVAAAAFIGVTIVAHYSGLPTPVDTVTTLLQPFEGSAGGRLRRWQNAVPMIADHPWFGVGPGRWLDIFPRYRDRVVADPDTTSLPLNAHLGLLAECGVIAFLAWCFFLGSLLRGRSDEWPEKRALQMALVSWLVAACFHAVFLFRHLEIAFWLTLALVGATRRPTHHLPHRWALRIATVACVVFALGAVLEGRFLNAFLHDQIVTSYVRYVGDQGRMLLPARLRSAHPWLEQVFAAALYREHEEELQSIGRWSMGRPTHLFTRIAAAELRDGRCESALRWLTSAEQTTTETPQTYRMRCFCETRLGRPEQARQTCEAGLMLNDRDPLLHHALGDAQVELGDITSALRSYGRARQMVRAQLSATFGAHALSAEREWYAALQRAASQDESLRRTHGIPRTAEEVLEEIAWTPQTHKSVAVDETAVYFSTNITGGYQIWRLPLAGGQAPRGPELLTNGQRAPFRLRRSPSMPRLYFVADNDGDYDYHLYVLDLDANSVRRLTSGAPVAEYEISPDGRWLALKREHGRQSEICVTDADGRDERCLTSRATETHDLSWHPDGQHLLFVENDTRLVELDLAGRQRTLLDLPEGKIAFPTFDPAGERIALVVHERGSLASIQELTPVSGRLRKLTARAGDYLSPLWLDEERLLFRENVNDHYALRTLATHDGSVTNVGTEASVIYAVALSANRDDAFFLRSDQSLPIALERLSLSDGRAEALLRLDWVRESDVIPGERWQVRIGERDLPAYLYTPPGAAPEHGWPCVIWLHGLSNGFSPRWHPYAQYFARAGFAFVALNYSGSPGLPWLDSDPSALLARQVDEVRGFRQLLSARKEIDAGRLFLVGVSAGTRILQEVLRPDPQLYAGAVEYSPIFNPAWRTPQAHLPPMLVFLGENDRYLRPSTRLAEIDSQRSLGSRVEVVRFGDEGHDLRGLADGARQLQETVRFLRDVDAERESPAMTEATGANSAKKPR